MEGCEVYQLGNQDSAQESDFAIEVNNPVGSVALVRNYIHDVTGGGIQISSETGDYADNYLVAYNVIQHSGSGSCENVTAGKLAGIKIRRADDVKIHSNVIAYGGASGLARGLFVRYYSRNLSLKNNVFYNNLKRERQVK